MPGAYHEPDRPATEQQEGAESERKCRASATGYRPGKGQSRPAQGFSNRNSGVNRGIAGCAAASLSQKTEHGKQFPWSESVEANPAV